MKLYTKPLSMERWDEDFFLACRPEILARWRTGKEVDLTEALAYQRQLPPERIHQEVVARGVARGELLIQVGFGYATLEQNIKALEETSAAGADLVYVHVDTYTRKNRYDLAERALRESEARGHSLLNGFPYVNHGVGSTRRLLEATAIPIRIGGSNDEEPMLTAEIGFAAGATCTSNFDFHDLVQHSRAYPLDRRIINAQYNNRLAAYYQERGAPIHIVQVGNVHGFVPPGLLIAIELLHTILCVAQGVRSITLGPGLMVHLIQDVATLRIYKRLAREYLERFGFGDVTMYLYYWPWMGDWPLDEFRAAGLAATCAAIAVLAGVDYAYVKSLEEARQATGIRGNLGAIAVTRQVIQTLKRQRLPDGPELLEEMAIQEAEVRCIVDRVVEMGDGDVAVGMTRAVEAGCLDSPFPSWIHGKGAVAPIRDATGAMRYLDTGGLPFSKDIIEYHRRKVSDRERAEKVKVDLDVLARDLLAMSGPLEH